MRPCLLRSFYSRSESSSILSLRAPHLFFIFFFSPSSPLISSLLCAPSEIFVHGDLQWDVFQVIISRSTTPDLIKIGMKLQEFFTQQFDTSKRALSTWGPGPYLPPKAPVINTEKGGAELCKPERFCPAFTSRTHLHAGVSVTRSG